ncbi:ABC transporter I family member 10-like [Miscanthus floridulus]|uniref:ABC transporter I family member 10-like n=1 Tax=Miscanthus floridulus TaxID=154761 RepID=UPI00345910D7
MSHGLAGGGGPLWCCPSVSSSSTTIHHTLDAPPCRSLAMCASTFPPPAAPAIEGRDVGLSVTTRRGRVLLVLKGCSLLVPPGQLWMLLSPNGCGKSTLLKVLAGFLNPSTGTVYINRPCSYVFQNPDHQVVMPTVESDVAFGLGKLKLPLDEFFVLLSKGLHSLYQLVALLGNSRYFLQHA